jgi:hypothetical protein
MFSGGWGARPLLPPIHRRTQHGLSSPVGSLLGFAKPMRPQARQQPRMQLAAALLSKAAPWGAGGRSQGPASSRGRRSAGPAQLSGGGATLAPGCKHLGAQSHAYVGIRAQQSAACRRRSCRLHGQRQLLDLTSRVTKRGTRLFTCNTTFPAPTQALARKSPAQHLGIRCERSLTQDPRDAGEPTRGPFSSRYRVFEGAIARLEGGIQPRQCAP